MTIAAFVSDICRPISGSTSWARSSRPCLRYMTAPVLRFGSTRSRRRRTKDALTERLRVVADDFVCLYDDDDPAAARKIAADDLDLLVELMAHSAYSRPGIMARKPARVVATHLGSHGALGKV